MLAIIGILATLFLSTIKLLSEETQRVENAGSLEIMMLGREIDHLRWINALQRYVLDPEATTLSIQADPHKCGLGTWFYGEGRQRAEAYFPELAQQLKSLEEPHTALHASAAEVRKLKEAGEPAKAIDVYDSVSVPSVKTVQGELQGIIDVMAARQKSSMESFAASVVSSRFVTLALVGVAFLLSLGLGLLLAKTVTAPTVLLARFANKVAGGDLDASIRMERKDEIGSLAANLQRMVTSINTMIGKADEKTREAEESAEIARKAVQEAEAALKAAEQGRREGMLAAASQLEGVVSTISQASENLSSQILQSDRGAEEQAARVGETATAMEQMTATVLEVAGNATAASGSSIQTKEKAEEGAVVVRQAVTEIQNVQALSLAMKKDIAILAEQADAISSIMNVISDIADQTNLLALNAAIEAARAGDAGRGFAVVADEVRKLAEKTMASTANVGQSISGIQTSVSESIAQVEKAVSMIDNATEQANRSGAMLAEIVTLADDTAGQVQAIATASEEQSATCEAINKSVAQINSIAGQTARAMQDANKAVADLAEEARGLSSLIAEMKAD